MHEHDAIDKRIHIEREHHGRSGDSLPARALQKLLVQNKLSAETAAGKQETLDRRS